MLLMVATMVLVVLVRKKLEGEDIRTHPLPQIFLIASAFPLLFSPPPPYSSIPLLPVLPILLSSPSCFPSSVLLLPPSHLPLIPVSLTGQLFPGLSASVMRPRDGRGGRSTLAHPFSIQLHLSLSGKRTPPPVWIVGSPTGTPDLTCPLHGPVPWSPSLRVVSPKSLQRCAA